MKSYLNAKLYFLKNFKKRKIIISDKSTIKEFKNFKKNCKKKKIKINRHIYNIEKKLKKIKKFKD